MDPKDKDQGDEGAAYLMSLAEAQGVSVATLKDGWMFAFTEEKLKLLLATAQKGGGKVVVMVQNSALIPASKKN